MTSCTFLPPAAGARVSKARPESTPQDSSQRAAFPAGTSTCGQLSSSGRPANCCRSACACSWCGACAGLLATCGASPLAPRRAKAGHLSMQETQAPLVKLFSTPGTACSRRATESRSTHTKVSAYRCSPDVSSDTPSHVQAGQERCRMGLISCPCQLSIFGVDLLSHK